MLNRKVLLLLTLSLLMSIVLFHCVKKSENTEKPIESIDWLTDLNTAISKAAEMDKPIMIDFMAEWCPPCHAMEDSTFSNADVIKKAQSFIPLRIDVDEQQDIANKYNGNASKYGGVGIPNILFMKADETKLKHVIGYHGPQKFIAVMDSVLTLL